MKITDKRVGGTKYFCMLNVGDAFEYDGEIHMKVGTDVNEINVINLSNASTEYFDREDEVVPVNCELIIS